MALYVVPPQKRSETPREAGGIPEVKLLKGIYCIFMVSDWLFLGRRGYQQRFPPW